MKRELSAEQRAKSDERKARFRALAKQIGDMSDAERATLAAKIVGIATIEGRGLSQHNACLLAFQNPSATLVGGFRQWIKAGRAVRKGEHGLMIWCPMTRKGVESADGSAAPDDTRFIIGTVFDVSQTDEIQTGAELAEVGAA